MYKRIGQEDTEPGEDFHLPPTSFFLLLKVFSLKKKKKKKEGGRGPSMFFSSNFSHLLHAYTDSDRYLSRTEGSST